MTKKTKRTIVIMAALTVICTYSLTQASSPGAQTALPIETADGVASAEATQQGVQEPTGELTLLNAVALVLVHNPELRAFSWETRISEATELQASLRPNPGLEFEAEQLGASQGAEMTIRLSQLIEMGDKRRKRIRYASAQKRLSAIDYEARRLDILTQVQKIFVDLLAAQQSKEFAEQTVALSKKVLDAVRTRIDAGKDSPLEETRAQIAMSNAEVNLAAAKRTLEASRRKLAAMWASRQPVFEKALGDLDNLGDVPSPDQLARLIDSNPDLARWVLEIEQRRAALDLERAKSKADITVGGGLQYLSESSESAMTVGVSVPIQFFNTNQGGRLGAANRLEQAAEQRKAAEMRINITLTEAHLALSNAHAKATELKNNVLQNAQTLFEAAKMGYEYGKFDYLHLLDAQRTLFEARQQYVESLAAFHRARADVERLIGRSVEDSAKDAQTEK